MNKSGRPPIGVIGGSGYTGRELLRILAGHGGVEVAFATSRSEVGEETVVPGLRYTDHREVDDSSVELLFLCLPHGEAARWMEGRSGNGTRIVDLTADHRPGSGREERAVYGLAEIHGSRVADAPLVANPGCYPTGILLALLPLAHEGLLSRDRVVTVAAASGTTGAGRSPRRELLFAEVSGDFRPYSLGNSHRHLREIRSELPGQQLLFIPHLLPVSRGILETMTVPVVPDAAPGRIREIWRRRYSAHPSVEVIDSVPSLSDVVGTDRLVLAVTSNEGIDPPVATVVAALDNLGKGAAGQAVQNMNRMLGLSHARGLRC